MTIASDTDVGPGDAMDLTYFNGSHSENLVDAFHVRLSLQLVISPFLSIISSNRRYLPDYDLVKLVHYRHHRPSRLVWGILRVEKRLE